MKTNSVAYERNFCCVWKDLICRHLYEICHHYTVICRQIYVKWRQIKVLHPWRKVRSPYLNRPFTHIRADFHPWRKPHIQYCQTYPSVLPTAFDSIRGLDAWGRMCGRMIVWSWLWEFCAINFRLFCHVLFIRSAAFDIIHANGMMKSWQAQWQKTASNQTFWNGSFRTRSYWFDFGIILSRKRMVNER